MLNLLVLSHLVHDAAWTDRIERTLRLFGTRLEQSGRAVPAMASGLSTYHAGPRQLMIVGDRGAGALERVVLERWQPFLTTLAIASGRQEQLGKLLPVVGAMRPIDGEAAAYLCRNFSCRQAVTTAEALEREL